MILLLRDKRVFMGHDASIVLGNNIIINADRNSTRYKQGILSGADYSCCYNSNIYPDKSKVAYEGICCRKNDEY